LTNTSDHPDQNLLAGYVSIPTAPIIYFDYAPIHGMFDGAVIQVELAARTLTPLANGSVVSRMVEVARIRCSPAAAKGLKDALEAALKMLEHPRSPPMAATRPN
jgi:hypothetical protein